jgi:hypothetical protein
MGQHLAVAVDDGGVVVVFSPVDSAEYVQISSSFSVS